MMPVKKVAKKVTKKKTAVKKTAKKPARKKVAKKPAKKPTVAAPVAEASGQWILGTVGVGKQKDGTIDSTGLKGFAVRLGEDGKKGIAYDLDLCRPIGAWSGKFTTEMNLMSRGDYPTAMGETIFVTGDFAGFMPGADAPSLAPRKGFGPLPVGQARFKGFHNAGRSVVVRWEVGGVALDETAEVVTANEVQFIVRTLEVAAAAEYDSAYTFIFSPREGTEAALMVDKFCDPTEVGDRFERLRVVVERSALAKHMARIGRTETIMVEGPSKRDPEVLTGRTEQNKLVHFHTDRPLRAGTLATALITDASTHFLRGELVEVLSVSRHRTRFAVTAG
jgi:hypothetical protein